MIIYILTYISIYILFSCDKRMSRKYDFLKFPSLEIRISDETNVILSNQTDHGTSRLLFRKSQKSLGRIYVTIPR